jgi:hypothetical protein
MNYPPNYPTAPVEMVDLQQQVARLQALLETSRQVHSAVWFASWNCPARWLLSRI